MALAPGSMLTFNTAALPPLIPLSVLYDERFERDVGHVAQTDERAVGVGAHDDILELGHRREASAAR